MPRKTKHHERVEVTAQAERGQSDALTFWSAWIIGESAEQDAIKVKKVYIDINDGNLADGVLFSQIMYWHGVNAETRQPRMTIVKDGQRWLAKQYDEWYAECRINYESARASIGRMVRRRLLIKKVYRFNGMATVHLRVNPEAFQKAVLEQQQLASENAINRKPQDAPVCDTVPIRSGIQSQTGLVSNRKPLTITTAITTTETTKENTSPNVITHSEARDPFPEIEKAPDENKSWQAFVQKKATDHLSAHGFKAGDEITQGDKVLGRLGESEEPLQSSAKVSPAQSGDTWNLINLNTGEVVDTLSNPIEAKSRCKGLNALGGAKFVTRIVKPDKPLPKPWSALTRAAHEAIPESIRPPRCHYGKQDRAAQTLYEAGFSPADIVAFVEWSYQHDDWLRAGGTGGASIPVTMSYVEHRIKAWKTKQNPAVPQRSAYLDHDYFKRRQDEPLMQRPPVVVREVEIDSKIQAAWDAAMSYLQTAMSADFEAWIRPMRLRAFEQLPEVGPKKRGKCLVDVPTERHKEWLQDRVLITFGNQFSREIGYPCGIYLTATA